MAKASDNPFPSVLLVEQAATPATPAAGQARLYRATDNKLYVVDDTGAAIQVGGGTGGGSVPVSTVRTAGNITISSTAWGAVSTTLDITIPAQTGDVVEVGASYLAGDTAASYLFMDFATVVTGTIVNRWGGSEGIAGLMTVAGSRDGKGMSLPRTLVSGDISGGNVTLRLVAALGSATSRIIKADTFDPLQFWAKNHSR